MGGADERRRVAYLVGGGPRGRDLPGRLPALPGHRRPGGRRRRHHRRGPPAIKIVAAPGHCDGHLVVLASIAGRSILLSGDCLFAGGRVSLQAIHDCQLDRYPETVITLAGRDVDVLLSGHGDPVLRDAGSQIRTVAESFRRLVPPPNVGNG